MKRHSALLVLVLLALGCSDSTGPGDASVSFRLDAQTCTRAHTLAFYVDGLPAGSQQLAPGSTSEPIQTTRARHVLGVKEPGTTLEWAGIEVDLNATPNLMQLLSCR